ncbi:DNA-binding response regulator [Pseudoclavibacter sp. RFBG4]|uniref:LytR/AlgR family response regulator transcription factor n=1 Tax=Pseudoclavibacter sp. RFBG4 TaxID=2080575 RepID=UPI000CE872CE|nr:LytTR family DNA-binding domain-containing protein [Pseudoclavibacter sp. RFBG4]PPG26339.1 DNA-binding response regulator [Pseudoclavibacter sp. RFBG4]
MMRVLAADDEVPALNDISRLLRADPRVEDVIACTSGVDALRRFDAHAVDAVFLDIHMPGLLGTELARSLQAVPRPPAVVFITADETRAVEAFELRALDYLLKPIRADRLGRALDRVEDFRASSPEVEDEVLTISLGSAIHLMRRSEVRWVDAEGDYSRLHTGRDQGRLIRVPISELERRWADAGFARVHRSHLVRTSAITEFRLTGADPVIKLGEVAIPVSRRLLPSVRRIARGEASAS